MVFGHRFLVLALAIAWASFGPRDSRADEVNTAQPTVAAPNSVVPPPAVVAAELPPPWFGELPKLWTGSVDFGINGSEGNSQNFNILGSVKAKRDTDASTMTWDSLYNFANANNDRTANRFLSTLRNEWKFGDSPWTFFADGSFEYDEFWAFDARVATHVGVGRQLIKSDLTSLKSRLGFGVSRQIGGDFENRLFPELVIGIDYERKIADRSKFVFNLDYFPDVGDFENYRAQANAALEFQLDPESCMFLKLGCLDRYNTNPQGRQRNDFTYYVSLMWKFGQTK